MNKDEIQPFTVPSGIRACCGLVMNKDEIQLPSMSLDAVMCCGLVMNKDEIQRRREGVKSRRVVVW